MVVGAAMVAGRLWLPVSGSSGRGSGPGRRCGSRYDGLTSLHRSGVREVLRLSGPAS
jgi:hypothetical protein